MTPRSLDEVRDGSALYPSIADPLLEEVVAKALDELSEAQREVSLLRLNGWKIADIASETNRSVGTVRKL